MISIEMLPAAHGDSLWIEYGSSKETKRILIDGGPAHTYESALQKRMKKLMPAEKRIFELMVVTHIDADHIDGALILLQDKDKNPDMKFQVKEFWFNAWEQLPKVDRDTFAPLQGEFLGGLLNLDTKLKQVWNKSFAQSAVMVNDDKPLPVITLAGGAQITLLGPTIKELKRLRARWSSAIRDFSPGDAKEAVKRLLERREYKPPDTAAVFATPQYGADRTPANGSSISFLLEYGGASLLLLGDAHAPTIASSLKRLASERSLSTLEFDAVKLPHHGSMANVSKEWLELIKCKRWLISTSGAVFGHPDIETAELIAQVCPDSTFYCNYETEITRKLANKSGWSVVFPNKKSSKHIGTLLQLKAKASSKSA